MPKAASNLKSENIALQKLSAMFLKEKYLKGDTSDKEGFRKLFSETEKDFENVTDIKGVFDTLFKNPAKLMNLVKSVSEKLDSRMKSGDINEQEMMSETGDLVNKLKDIPGLGNIQSLISGLNLNNLSDPKKEKVVPKTNKYKMKNPRLKPAATSSQPQLTDDDIIELFKSIAPQK